MERSTKRSTKKYSVFNERFDVATIGIILLSTGHQRAWARTSVHSRRGAIVRHRGVPRGCQVLLGRKAAPTGPQGRGQGPPAAGNKVGGELRAAGMVTEKYGNLD